MNREKYRNKKSTENQCFDVVFRDYLSPDVVRRGIEPLLPG